MKLVLLLIEETLFHKKIPRTTFVVYYILQYNVDIKKVFIGVISLVP